MNKSKYSEEQIATALRQVDAGELIPDVTRSLGVSEATYYVWRKKYGQIAVAESRRVRQLEDENRKPVEQFRKNGFMIASNIFSRTHLNCVQEIIADNVRKILSDPAYAFLENLKRVCHP